MARVNITVPDDLLTRARAVGVNVPRIASQGLVEELDRREKVAALDAYLADLEAESGPATPEEEAGAAAWADRILGVPGVEDALAPAAPARRTA